MFTNLFFAVQCIEHCGCMVFTFPGVNLLSRRSEIKVLFSVLPSFHRFLLDFTGPCCSYRFRRTGFSYRVFFPPCHQIGRPVDPFRKDFPSISHIFSRLKQSCLPPMSRLIVDLLLLTAFVTEKSSNRLF